MAFIKVIIEKNYQPLLLFCIAKKNSISIVLRARVWSEPRDAIPTKGDEFSFLFPDQVYSLKIVEIFKGKEKVNQLPGLVSVGVRSPSLMIDLHTPTRFISCSFSLQNGKEYLLSGYIHNDKMRSSFCGFRWKWTHVTPQLSAGLKGQFNESC